MTSRGRRNRRSRGRHPMMMGDWHPRRRRMTRDAAFVVG